MAKENLKVNTAPAEDASVGSAEDTHLFKRTGYTERQQS